MYKKIILSLLLTVFPTLLFAQVPKDFHFEYENRSGVAMGTVEKIVVTPGLITVTRNAKQVGEAGGKEKSVKTYRPDEEQMKKLLEIIFSSGFMEWPASAEMPHQSHADEYISITMNEKTVRHTKWEEANQEAFRILFTNFNDWYTDVRAVRF